MGAAAGDPIQVSDHTIQIHSLYPVRALNENILVNKKYNWTCHQALMHPAFPY
jgi:hypothetical protein